MGASTRLARARVGARGASTRGAGGQGTVELVEGLILLVAGVILAGVVNKASGSFSDKGIADAVDVKKLKAAIDGVAGKSSPEPQCQTGGRLLERPP